MYAVDRNRLRWPEDTGAFSMSPVWHRFGTWETALPPSSVSLPTGLRPVGGVYLPSRLSASSPKPNRSLRSLRVTEQEVSRPMAESGLPGVRAGVRAEPEENADGLTGTIARRTSRVYERLPVQPEPFKADQANFSAGVLGAAPGEAVAL